MVAADLERADDELLSILSREIDRLHEKYRLPIILCRLEGMTHQQAADQLGWPPGTVGTRLAPDSTCCEAHEAAARQQGRRSIRLAWRASPPHRFRQLARRPPSAGLNMVMSGEASAAWTSNVLALARAAQSAAFKASLRYFTVFAMVVAGGCLIAIAGRVPGVTHKFRVAVGSLVKTSSPALLRFQVNDALKPSNRAEEPDKLTVAGRVLDPEGKPLVRSGVSRSDGCK